MIPLPWLDDTVITIWKLENVRVECGPRLWESVFNNGDALKEHCLHEAVPTPIHADADNMAFPQGSNLAGGPAVGNGLSKGAQKRTLNAGRPKTDL